MTFPIQFCQKATVRNPHGIGVSGRAVSILAVPLNGVKYMSR